MNINATLFGQSITFAIFIWFTMKFVWPPIVRAMQDREKTIADGLAAAKKGEERLTRAEEEVHAMLGQAREKANHIIKIADQRADEIVREAQAQALVEGKRLMDAAQDRIEQEKISARHQLRAEVVSIAMSSAEKLIQRTMDDQHHRDLLDKMVSEQVG
jgi:F-type H+-transporting ATPase subunit b